MDKATILSTGIYKIAFLSDKGWSCWLTSAFIYSHWYMHGAGKGNNLDLINYLWETHLEMGQALSWDGVKSITQVIMV